MFITFEGTEGCGKSTQVKLFAEYLASSGIPFVSTREPGGSNTGKKIREILLDSKNREITSRAELLLYAADRAQHVEEVIRPALLEGKTVLCDRYTDATWAYQGFGRGLDLGLIENLNTLAAEGVRPDLTFWIDCPVEVGLRRAFKRAEDEEIDEMRFENEELSFHRRVRDGYRSVSEAEAERFAVVDGTAPVHEIHKTCVEIFINRSAVICSKEREER